MEPPYCGLPLRKTAVMSEPKGCLLAEKLANGWVISLFYAH